VPEAPLTEADLAALRQYDTPTICNALEIVVPERRAIGFTTETVIAPFPAMPPMVGYARTATYRSMQPSKLAGAAMRQSRIDYYSYVGEGSEPKISIVQDLDSRPGFGCFWGEVNTAVHKALGCLGLITNGGVRDLDAVAPDFQILCGKVTPSHAHGHAVNWGEEVDIFGMIVQSGDLIHADRHGAVVIPHAVARDVPAAAQLCMRREEPILKVARGADFSIEKLAKAMGAAADIP
jgi:regulator of RNase E activity RraA